MIRGLPAGPRRCHRGFEGLSGPTVQTPGSTNRSILAESSVVGEEIATSESGRRRGLAAAICAKVPDDRLIGRWASFGYYDSRPGWAKESDVKVERSKVMSCGREPADPQIERRPWSLAAACQGSVR